MKIKEQLMKELDTLKPSEVIMVYDLMLSLKGSEKKTIKPSQSYLKVREALRGYKKSMSEDILLARKDRI